MTNFPARAPLNLKILVAVAVLSIAASAAHAQRGPGNGQFFRYPFDQWASENGKPQIRWNVRIDPAYLSPHQRMITQLNVAIDGAELQKRRSNGQLLIFVRIEDSAGHRYQTGNQTSVGRLHPTGRFGELDWSVSAFILPGDYVVSMAVCDTRTLEHSFLRRNLHVAAINADPLPGAWKDLPPVEFLPMTGNPEAWYLPQLHSAIRLPLETQRPVRIELLVNTTPATLGSLNTFRQNMELIMPAMKVLMGIDPAGGSIGLSIVDLSRLAMSYRQPDLRDVNGTWGDWLKLRPAFSELRTATIDVRTLAGQRRMLDYLAAEATRSLGPADPADKAAHVLIVLSAPVYFTQQNKPAAPDLPPDPSRRIFYICYSPLAILRLDTPAPFLPESPSMHVPLYTFTDDIEHVLKPMGARVFRVTKPEEFRKAVGTILDEIPKVQSTARATRQSDR